MKRERGYAATAAVVGAGVALFAASRVWMSTELRVTGPLPSGWHEETGSELVPWLPAVALVALAGAGAVLATRGVPRAIVGVLLVLCGLGIVASCVVALAAGAPVWWPALAGVGGLAVIDAGVLTVLRGRSWPGMAARYERPAAAAEAAADPTANPTATVEATTSPAMWDALDRGEDPTR